MKKLIDKFLEWKYDIAYKENRVDRKNIDEVIPIGLHQMARGLFIPLAYIGSITLMVYGMALFGVCFAVAATIFMNF